jgi:LysM repeat protein
MLALCLLAASVTGGLLASSSQAADPGERTVVVVRPGDTLWSVVARHLPSRDPHGMIEEIQRLNHLRGSTIHPGQELVLP